MRATPRVSTSIEVKCALASGTHGRGGHRDHLAGVGPARDGVRAGSERHHGKHN